MDKKLTERVESVGSILAVKESAQMPLVEAYLEKHHAGAWELVLLDRGGRGKHEAANSKASLLKAYKAWLVRHDRAWALASEMLAYPELVASADWEKLAIATAKSKETCRQVVQALQRGGY